VTRVRLHIDRLTLEGAGVNGPGAIDRRTLGRAVERELARLLGAQPLVNPQPQAHERVDAGNITLQPKPTAANVGAQIGGALHAAIANPQARGRR
jgi:hypothetical protein